MKNSIKTKLIILIVVTVAIPAIILGGTGVYFAARLTDEYANDNISLICEKNAAEIDVIFSPMEKAVDYMAINAVEEISNPMNLSDPVYFENYIDKMRSILGNTANNTDGAITVYLRIDPAIAGPVAGLFLTRDSLDSNLVMNSITDLSVYDEDDVEHVGWYYQPIKAGEPIWMLPYYNQNIGVYMISYVVPLIKNGRTIGVLGMDINFNYITDQIKNIKLYDSGYAYITDAEGNVIYHPDIAYGEYATKKKGWSCSERTLQNGMVLHITAPVSEINESRNNLVINIFVSILVLLAIFIAVTIIITNKMVAPLKRLNHIAEEIADGNYNVDFNFIRPDDEIGQLTKSFEHTVAKLKEYSEYMNGLAYTDALTGVRNRTAYEYQISNLEEIIKNGEKLQVAIAVFDVNGLKQINDTLGHEKGDELLTGSCKIICHAFSHCPVFRIGGDEFVTIIRDSSYDKIDKIFSDFVNDMKETWSNEVPEQQISIAYGYAKYDSEIDNMSLESVFKRADEIMYEKKKSMKEKGYKNN